MTITVRGSIAPYGPTRGVTALPGAGPWGAAGHAGAQAARAIEAVKGAPKGSVMSTVTVGRPHVEHAALVGAGGLRGGEEPGAGGVVAVPHHDAAGVVGHGLAA